MLSHIIEKRKNVLYLTVTVSVIAIFAYWLWQMWPSILMAAFRWQRENNAELSALFYAVKQHKTTAYASLAWISFLYGVVHSVGPGHGKVIVTTFLATHPTKIKQAFLITIGSAIMQAVVAVALVSTLVFIFDGSMRDVNTKVPTLINLSLGAVILLGMSIVYKTLRQLWKTSKHQHSPSHCGCGHTHAPDAESINRAHSWGAYVGIIMSIGIRPCTGAIMILLFSKVVDLYWLGIVSAFLMAVGTAITTSSIAFFTISGKRFIRRYIHAPQHHISVGQLYLQLIGGTILILFGTLLIRTSSFNLLLAL